MNKLLAVVLTAAAVAAVSNVDLDKYHSNERSSHEEVLHWLGLPEVTFERTDALHKWFMDKIGSSRVRASIEEKIDLVFSEPPKRLAVAKTVLKDKTTVTVQVNDGVRVRATVTFYFTFADDGKILRIAAGVTKFN